jgi:hypothetical protein
LGNSERYNTPSEEAPIKGKREKSKFVSKIGMKDNVKIPLH